MDISRLTLFGATSARLGWLSQRQGVLAQNIANADTPNYVPMDLKPLDFRARLRMAEQKLRVARTDDQHFGSSRTVRRHRESESREPYEMAPAGNSVVMEEQLMRMNQTAMDHQLATHIYRKYVGMIRTALGQGAR